MGGVDEKANKWVSRRTVTKEALLYYTTIRKKRPSPYKTDVNMGGSESV